MDSILNRNVKLSSSVGALAVVLIIAGLASRVQAQCGGLTVGPNVDVSTRVGNEAEPNIAIDPTNPLRLFACAVLTINAELGSYSTDGGVTWNKRSFLTGGDGMPAACCDAQLAWDSYGNLFVTYINSGVSAIIVGMSTNGGVSFTQIGTFSGSVDQPSIAVGPGAGGVNGSVWVDYNIGGTMRVRSASVTGLGAVGAFSAETAPPSATGSFGGIAVGPSGQCMIAYQSPTSGQGPATIYANVDPDGIGGAGFGSRITVTTTNVGGFDYLPAQNGRSVDAEAGLAWDRTGGAHNGRVYMVYSEETVNENNDFETYLRYSDNNGTTWSSPIRVNDDPMGNGKSQFLPYIAIDQTTGNIAMSWMDCRNSPANNTAENWAAIGSYVGGVLTISPNVKVSTGLSNANTAGSGIDYGDYLGICFHAGVFYPVWSDNSGTIPGYTGSPAFDTAIAKVTVTSGVNTPTNPTAAPPQVCAGSGTTLSATVNGGETVDWFTGSCGGTAVPGGANPTVTPASTTTYYARARNTSSGCVSDNCATVTVTINPAPNAPSSASASPDRICVGQSSTLSATVGGGETVDWFTVRCNRGTPVPGGANPTVSPTVTTTYYAIARNLGTNCSSAACATVTVTLADHTGDFDGGGVGLSDVPTFVSILLSPGGPQDCIADMNADGNVDGLDIAPFLAAMPL